MRSGWSLLAATLVLAACKKDAPPDADAGAISAAAKGTSFTKIAPAVGTKRQESSDLRMTMAMTVDGRKDDTSVTESVRRTDEVLAVAGNVVTKVKTKFETVESTQPSAIAKKTYVVEAKDGKLDVRDEQGKPSPPGEAREVEKHFKNLGKPDPMLAALPATALVPGQKVDAIAEALTEHVKEPGESMTVKDVVVTFREGRAEEGIFDVTMKLTKEEGPVSMVIDVKGETWVSTKTGATTKMTLAGPIRVAGGNAVKVDGSGKMSMKMEATTL